MRCSARAIDLLAAQHDDSLVVCCRTVQKEDNSYVRAQISQLLAQLKRRSDVLTGGASMQLMRRSGMLWKKRDRFASSWLRWPSRVTRKPAESSLRARQICRFRWPRVISA